MSCPANTVLASAATNGFYSPDPGTLQIIIAQLTCDLKAAIQASGGGGSLVYRAVLTQSGIGAPVASVLENTIGSIVWSYGSPGTYFATLVGAFTNNKTFCMISPGIDAQAGLFSFFQIFHDTANAIQVLSGTSEFLVGIGLADGLLLRTAVEIRVYP